MDTTTTTSKQSTVLAGAGALFLILAGFFLWRDLSLPRELVVTVAALFAGTATALQWPKRWPILAPVALILTVAVARGKAALYDTSHLHGYLRIGVLAAVGALLVFGARVLTGARKELV